MSVSTVVVSAVVVLFFSSILVAYLLNRSQVDGFSKLYTAQQQYSQDVRDSEMELRERLAKLEEKDRQRTFDMLVLEQSLNNALNLLTLAIAHIEVIERMAGQNGWDIPEKPQTLGDWLERKDKPRGAYNLRFVVQKIAEMFSSEELDDLLFDLEVPEGEITGERMKTRAREAVQWFTRQDRLEELMAVLREERPFVDW